MLLALLALFAASPAPPFAVVFPALIAGSPAPAVFTTTARRVGLVIVRSAVDPATARASPPDSSAATAAITTMAYFSNGAPNKQMQLRSRQSVSELSNRKLLIAKA